MSGNGTRRRVAIACQGGGSHTAFTGGVLQGLLQRLPDDVEVVALSGASGGAICAALAWSGLVRNDAQFAVDQLDSFWLAMGAREPWDQISNQLLMGLVAFRDLGMLPEVSPYHLPPWGADYFRNLIDQHFDFEELRELARKPGAPALQIGAVEVLSGHFELFTGPQLCAECLLASAAIPELFRAVSVPGRGVFWDGLFSQNPPIHELTDFDIDELWVVQINPSSCARVPTENREISDRRNALSGNLSMEQELRFIESINRKLAQGKVSAQMFKHVEVARIALDRELDHRSKLDRRPVWLEELREYGKTKCRWFLREREARRQVPFPTRPGGPETH